MKGLKPGDHLVVPEDLTLRGDGRIRRSKGTLCPKEEDKTRQADAAAADVNRIVYRFAVEGVMPKMRTPLGFADVSHVTSYHEMANQVREMEEYFEALGPEIRGKFENDAEKMVRAFHAGEQKEVFMELGVIPRVETGVVHTPAPAPSVPPPAPVGGIPVVPAKPGNIV